MIYVPGNLDLGLRRLDGLIGEGFDGCSLMVPAFPNRISSDAQR